MQSDRPATGKLFAVRKDLLRGDSLFAVMIFAVVALFLFNLVATLWNNLVFQQSIKEKASVQKVKAVANVLAKTAETLITVDELSMLRRAVSEAGIEHELRTCRVVLPDDGVLADVDPAGISVIALPPTWEGEVPEYTEEFTRRGARFVFPLHIPGRGVATLEIADRADEGLQADLAAQTSQMAIACLALASMLLVHRHARFRLKAIGAIHEVLMAVRDDTADISTLELDPKLGREAVTWNKLLGERQSSQICSAIQQVKDAVHERSETAESLAAVFDTVPYGMVVVNDRMVVENANGAALALLQAEKSQPAYADMSTLIRDAQVVEAVRKATANPGSKRVVIEVEPAGTGTADVLRFTVYPVRHDDSQSALITIEDITQQRVAAAAMNCFLARAAHELRTPLTNIRLYVEEALEQCERDPAATSRSLNIMNNEIQRLDRTVAEVLSVSQIEAGSFAVRRDDVHLDSLLEQLKADHEARAREKQITFEVDIPPKVPTLQMDHDKIALTLHNLIGNAMKYTPVGGQVTVVTSVEEDHINVAVSDTGLGIGPEEVDRVFEKFYRSKNPEAAGIEGSGLGLAIAREVARLHGGDIVVESELGRGSTFTLTLPLNGEWT